jgi:GxxExxY protein
MEVEMLTRVRSVLPESTETVIERIIGCALEVHRELGPGYFEKIYHRALEIELSLQGLHYRAELPMGIHYKGHALHGQRIDLIVDSLVVVEVKAVARIEPIHESQVVSYLRSTRLHAGLLINFNTRLLKLGLKRIVV